MRSKQLKKRVSDKDKWSAALRNLLWNNLSAGIGSLAISWTLYLLAGLSWKEFLVVAALVYVLIDSLCLILDAIKESKEDILKEIRDDEF